MKALVLYGVPTRFRSAVLGDFTDKLQGRVNGQAPAAGFFLTGPAGTGKTHLAAAMLGHWWDIRLLETPPHSLYPNFEPCLAIWASVSEFIGTLIAGIRGDQYGKSPEWTVRTCQHAGALVLDDLGAEKTSEFSLSALYRVIEYRINEFNPTIVTSNLSLKQLNEWEPRIASRLGGMNVIKMGGRDRRLTHE